MAGKQGWCDEDGVCWRVKGETSRAGKGAPDSCPQIGRKPCYADVTERLIFEMSREIGSRIHTGLCV